MEQSNISKSHKLSMDNRKRLTLTGIKDVVSFDLTQILLESTLGMIHIKGSDIKVTRLSLEKGEVDIEGTVDSIVYSDVKDYGEKGKSILKRMFILMSIYGGIVLIICYDVVRILRRIFPAKLFRVIVEDAIYWTFASIFMFNIFLRYNYGKPRFFSVIMALGTMAVFEWIIGRKIIDALALRIKKLGRILAKPLKKLCKVVKLIFYKVIKNIRAKKEKKNAGRKRKKSHVKAKHHKAKKNKE